MGFSVQCYIVSHTYAGHIGPLAADVFGICGEVEIGTKTLEEEQEALELVKMIRKLIRTEEQTLTLLAF